MDHLELMSMVGKNILIRGVSHLCFAAGGNTLLLLQFRENSEPMQYVVAHSPSWFKGELVWDHGDYFPLFYYEHSSAPMCSALREAALSMSDDDIYVAMAGDPIGGARCLGVFTSRPAAESVLETTLNTSHAIQDLYDKLDELDGTDGPDELEYLELQSKKHFTISEYEELRSRFGLDNEYYVHASTINSGT